MEENSSFTWLLFASGKYASVDTYIYPASPESPRPIDAYIVSECQGDFTKSARRAADQVYYIFQEKFDIKPLVVGYDIQTNNEQTLTGRSGGVSFVAALCKTLLASLGYDDLGDIAATGEILSRGEIGAINGINSKIKAAQQLLQPGSWFFYPMANNTEADQPSLDQLRKNGVNVKAVTTISEVINLLIPCYSKALPSKKNFKRKFIWLLLGSSIIVGIYFLTKQNIPRQYSIEQISLKPQIITKKKNQQNKSKLTDLIISPRKSKTKRNSPKYSVQKPDNKKRALKSFIFAPPIK